MEGLDWCPSALSGNGLPDEASSVVHVLRGVVGKEGPWVLGGRRRFERYSGKLRYGF